MGLLHRLKGMVQAMNLEVLGLVISIQGCLVADLCPIPPNQPYVHKQLQVMAFHLGHLVSLQIRKQRY